MYGRGYKKSSEDIVERVHTAHFLLQLVDMMIWEDMQWLWNGRFANFV
jgi:hypothetical protein